MQGLLAVCGGVLFTPLDDYSQFGGKKKFYKFIKHKKLDYNGVAAFFSYVCP